MENSVATKEKIAWARTLFAYALETPGGLKIQTLHAFCESLLRRFPLEANVPNHFEHADENISLMLREEALRLLLIEIYDHPKTQLSSALYLLLTIIEESYFKKLIIILINSSKS